MSEPTYIAKMVNGEYVFVRVDLPGTLMRTASTGLGLLLIRAGIRGSGVGAALALLGGGALAYQGISGHSIIELLNRFGRIRTGTASQTPSYPHQDDTKSQQVPEDRLEEAQMESFPASDPPASSHSS